MPSGSTATASRSSCSDCTISVVIAFSESGRFSVSCTTPAYVVRIVRLTDMAASLPDGASVRRDGLVPSPGCLRSLCPHRCPRSVRSTHRSPEWSRRSPPPSRRSGTAGSIPPRCSVRSVAAAPNRERSCTPRSPPTVRERSASAGSGPRPNRERWEIDAYGSGGEWLAGRIPRMLGSDDAGMAGVDTAGWSPTVTTALQASRHVSIGASSNLYHELLPTIVEQRITGFEAHRQWRRLCVELGDPAPGPVPRSPPAAGARSPPGPTRLVVPSARHRAQAGNGPRRGRATSRPPLGMGRPGAARRGRQVAAAARRAAPGPWGRCWRRRWATPTRSPSATIT